MRRSQAYMDEREAWIQSFIHKNGSITIEDMVSQFDISPSTARKQLNTMHENGDIIRTHGGAVASMGTKTPHISHYKEKWAIAEKARTLVEDGDIIAIGAGTTTLIFSLALSGIKNLTVVTDSIPVANQLRLDEEMEIRICGGMVRHSNGAAIGRDTENYFKNVRVMKAFVGADSIAAGTPVTSKDAYTSYVERAIVKSAKKVYVLADSSKVGKRIGVDKLADLEEIDGLVTNASANEKEITALKACDINVYLAK